MACKDCCGCSWRDVPKRYFVVILVSIGMCIIHAQRVNVAVAVVTILDESIHEKVATEKAISKLPTVTWDATMVGFLHAVFYIGYIITQLPGGYLATQLPSNRLFGGCIFMSCALNLLIPASIENIGYAVTCIIRFLQGISEGLLFPSCYAILWHWSVPVEKSRFGAMVLAGVYSGAVFGLPLSGTLTNYLGWDYIFYAHGLIGVVWCITWFLVAYEMPVLHPTMTSEELKYIAEQQKESNIIYEECVAIMVVLRPLTAPDIENPIIDVQVPWVAIFTSLPVHALNVCHFARSFVFFLLLTNEPTYLNVFGYGIAANGALSALPHLAMTVLAISSGPLADYLMSNPMLTPTHIRKMFTCIGFGMEGLCIFALYFVYTGTPAIIFLTLGVGCSGLTVSGWNINHLDLAPRYASVLIGLSTAFGTLAGIIMPPIVGAMTQKQVITEWQNVFLLTASILIFAAGFYAIFGSGKKQWWSEPQPTEVRLIAKYDPLSTKLYQTLPTQVGSQQHHPILPSLPLASPVGSPHLVPAHNKADKLSDHDRDSQTDDDGLPLVGRNKRFPSSSLDAENNVGIEEKVNISDKGDRSRDNHVGTSSTPYQSQ